jgi:hypothetical protein
LNTGVPLEGFKSCRFAEFPPWPEDDLIYGISCDRYDTKDFYITLAAEKGNRQREIFIYLSVEMDGVHSGQLRLFDDNCSVVFHVMERLDTIHKQVCAARVRYEKQAKILELRQGSVETWLNSLCAHLTQPYHISLQQAQAVLYILLPNDIYLNIAIPYNKFQEMIPELPAIIQNYVDVQTSSPARILLYKPLKGIDWEWTPTYDDEL